jgi:hypothetical protein
MRYDQPFPWSPIAFATQTGGKKYFVDVIKNYVKTLIFIVLFWIENKQGFCS